MIDLNTLRTGFSDEGFGKIESIKGQYGLNYSEIICLGVNSIQVWHQVRK